MSALAESRRTGRIATRLAQEQKDIILIAVLANSGTPLAAWSLRRVFNFSDSSELNKRVVLVGVMLVALLAVGIVLKLSFSLQRGFAMVQAGLDRLRSDLNYRLPDQDHELRSVVRAVNAMAESRQKLEAALRREDRLRVMGRVVAGIAHEIRNPLNSIRLTIRVLARRLHNQPEVAESVQLVIGEIDRLDTLLKSLLQFRPDEPPRIRRQPLQPILDRTLALVKPHASESEVAIHVQGAVESIAAVDSDFLQQALMNLLLNAIDASGRAGNVEVSLQPANSHLEILIEDSGPGLTPEQQDRLFEAFYTTKPGGTGLGLAVTKTLLDNMGAGIEYLNGTRGGAFSRDPACWRAGMKQRILIVEDERTALQALSTLLADEGYEPLKAETGEQGLRLALQAEPDLILLDIRLPDVDGLTVLERLRAGLSDAAVIIMTADTTSSNAIRATKLGAFDYVSKPINDEHLVVLIERALEYRKLEKEIRDLRKKPGSLPEIPSIAGHSLAMQEVYKLIGRVAASDATVLIAGESGTGKELIANAIHEFSSRAQANLVKVNCAAIPESLLESELFGHEKGAFTNALTRRVGRFEQAQGGTLFLDEIGELPIGLQAKLLRAIQERVIERLGGDTPIPVDFRLITATAQDLSAAVAAGRFREDLYYRLNVVTIPVPPLRERKEDIPLLVQRFLGRSDRSLTIRQDALEKIMAHDWPGNVRELENAITRAIVLAPGGMITPQCIQVPSRNSHPARSWLHNVPFRDGYWNVIRQVEKQLICAALAEVKGNKAEAARLLGIQRRLLYEKMEEHRVP